MQDNEALPAYTDAHIKQQLLANGASGTIYALVMPESEQAIMRVVDGGDFDVLLNDAHPHYMLQSARNREWLSKFHEPWTQKQDSMHIEYFDLWLRWSAPVVDVDANAFSYRYPTAGASEGIAKLMAEYATRLWSAGKSPSVHIFEGEYEGFPSFAKSFNIPVVRHRRDEWEKSIRQINPDAQFWISQPSSIDGGLWSHFDDFLGTMAKLRPDVEIIPDLSYVGSVANAYRISLNYDNVPAFVISQSKPFGGYYHRCGGVFAREERPSLFGNRWFKNLTSLAWAVEMMKVHGVFYLPRRYRHQQLAATEIVGQRLGIEGLEAAPISVLATAPVPEEPGDLIKALIRGAGSDRKVRICLTPAMTAMIAPHMAPSLAHFIASRES